LLSLTLLIPLVLLLSLPLELLELLEPLALPVPLFPSIAALHPLAVRTAPAGRSLQR
jgi:hypothetical protein